MSKNKIQVAVVDDDESFARAIERLLRAAGFGTVIYNSAEAFLKGFAAGAVNCLVLDVQLGGMSGLDLGRRLADMSARIPVIFITALETDDVSRVAAEIHGSVLLRKPVSSQALIGAIREATHSFPAMKIN